MKYQNLIYVFIFLALAAAVFFAGKYNGKRS